MGYHPYDDPQVQQDPTDLRDQFYRPSLRRLEAELPPPALLTNFPVRDQGRTGQCTGFSLAHLIDIHRQWTATSPADGVSALMLYNMARRLEQPSNAAEVSSDDGVHSLRSAIKGFYHYGVCKEQSWSRPADEADPSDSAETALDDDLTPDRAKEARGITLGAYYRIRPYLNDYHAALTEAQAILVSAEIHTGWDRAATGSSSGEIMPQTDGHGSHAFVLVGYNADGFLVLNSWGPDWGGWDGLRGVALWRYEDWADRVLDAWVLRLGVPAPGAFAYSNRPNGISFGAGPIQGPSSACHQLLGHFSHLDDGVHVERGSYASNRRSVEMTAELISAKPSKEDKQIVLSITGSLLDLKQAFAFEVARKPKLRSMGFYPYTIFWCNDVIESATAVLWRLMDDAIERVGRDSPNLDRRIEETCAGIGRAFWRDVKYAAEMAAAQDDLDPSADGDAAHLFNSFANVDGADLHLVVDGAGSILMAEYLLGFADIAGVGEHRLLDLQDKFFSRVASLSIVAPTLDLETFVRAFGPLMESLNRRGPGRVQLMVPSKQLEDRLSVGPYSKSILDLVLRSFEGRCGPEDRMVGMSPHRWRPGDRETISEFVPDGHLHEIDLPEEAEGRRNLDQSRVNYNEQGLRTIFQNIAAIRKELVGNDETHA